MIFTSSWLTLPRCRWRSSTSKRASQSSAAGLNSSLGSLRAGRKRQVALRRTNSNSTRSVAPNALRRLHPRENVMNVIWRLRAVISSPNSRMPVISTLVQQFEVLAEVRFQQLRMQILFLLQQFKYGLAEGLSAVGLSFG